MWILKMTSVVLLVLVLIPGVWSDQWRVNLYGPPSCLVTGSSVEFQCSYYYPTGQTVTTTTWYKKGYEEGSWYPMARTLPPDRVEYLGDKTRDCHIRINGLQESDTGYYSFRFETKWNKWTSKDSVYLSVKNVTAKVDPTTVNEGGWVSLHCETCPLITPYQILWFRDGQIVSNSGVRATREDAGSYTCAVKGQETIRSDPVVLDVRYGPQNVILSVSPPGGVVRGSSVTLTCSSDANPAVTEQGYSLYKRAGQSDTTVAWSKRVHTISNIQPSDSGQYYCQAKNTITSASSTLVQLDVQYGPQNVRLSVSPPGEVVRGSSVTLTCSSVANPAVTEQDYSLFKIGSAVTRSTRVHTFSNIQPSDSGQYYCQAGNTITSALSAFIRLDVQYGPQNVRLSVSPPGEVVRGSSVTLTCSSDANPAVTEQGYSLFTRVGQSDTTVAWNKRVHTISNIQPSDSGQYYCQTKNRIDSAESSFVQLDVQYPPGSVSVKRSPSASLAEGSSVNLTCSSEANPAVDSYTWYRRTGPPSSSSLVGSGQVLSLASLDPSQTGHYLCQARNSLGETNSTLEELTVQASSVGVFAVSAGAGVSVLVVLTLIMVLIWFWKKNKKAVNKDVDGPAPIYDNLSSGRGLNLSANQQSLEQEQEETLYAKIHTSSSSSPLAPSNVDIALHSIIKHPAQGEDEEVLYSNVTVRPRESRPPPHTESPGNLQDHLQSPPQALRVQEAEQVLYSTVRSRQTRPPQHSPHPQSKVKAKHSSNPGEGGDSLIYSTVVKP